jgi:hypothetical protein
MRQAKHRVRASARLYGTTFRWHKEHISSIPVPHVDLCGPCDVRLAHVILRETKWQTGDMRKSAAQGHAVLVDM